MGVIFYDTQIVFMNIKDNKIENLNKIVSLINNNFWFVKNVTLETTLEKDLGFTGNDGIEFLELFFNQYNIKNIDVSNYFIVENVSFFRAILITLGIKEKLNKPKFDLTLNHLTDIMDLGYWKDME